MGGDMPEKSRVKGDIRTSQHHDSAVKHVSGRAIYVDDIATCLLYTSDAADE